MVWQRFPVAREISFRVIGYQMQTNKRTTREWEMEHKCSGTQVKLGTHTELWVRGMNMKRCQGQDVNGIYWKSRGLLQRKAAKKDVNERWNQRSTHDPNNTYGKKLMVIALWGLPLVLDTCVTHRVTLCHSTVGDATCLHQKHQTNNLPLYKTLP